MAKSAKASRNPKYAQELVDPLPDFTVYTPITPRLALLKMASLGGLLTSVACFMFFVAVALLADVNPLTPIRNLDVGLVILGCVFTFWYVKNAREFGRFQFWEGLFMGFVLTLIAAILTGAFTYAYLKWVSPVLLQDYITWSVEMAVKMREQTLEKFNEAGYQAQLTSLRQMTAGDIWQDILIKKIVMGMIIVPIVAALMRKTVLQVKA